MANVKGEERAELKKVMNMKDVMALAFGTMIGWIMAEEIAAEFFREDFFYHISTIIIHIPNPKAAAEQDDRIRAGKIKFNRGDRPFG